MSAVLATPAAAPAAAPAAPAAPAAAPAATAAVAAPAAAPAPASLIHGDAPAVVPGAAPAAPADTNAFTFADKVLAKNAEGATDWEATARNAEKARQHLEQRLGAGDVPPKNAAEYQFQIPPDMTGFELRADKLDAFKTAALAQGITGKQFEFVMSQYLGVIPDLMEGAAAMSAQQARAELGKVWTQPADMESGISNATRALRALPAELQDATREYGTSPAFLRAMAHFGAQLREDRPPGSVPAPSPAGDVRALEASKAYTDPKHPDHVTVSRQVAEFYGKVHGNTPV